MEITLADVLLPTGAFVLLGLLVYLVGARLGLRDHEMPRFRWVGLALLVVATLLGARTLWRLFDPALGALYLATIPDSKIVKAHYVGLVLPLVAVGGLFAAEGWIRHHLKSLR